MEPVANRLIVARHRVRPNRACVLGIGPNLVIAEIAKKWIHSSCIIRNVLAPLASKAQEIAMEHLLHSDGAWITESSIVFSPARPIRN
jgi:hypothetical protein